MENKLNIAMVAACLFPVAQGSQVLIKQVSGALVKNDDSEGFAEGSIHLIKDPALAKRSGNNTRITASDYSWDWIAQEIEEMYQKVLD